jgi:hypothetical protein
MKIAHNSDYKERRRVEYPPPAEQLDSLWKLIAQMPTDSLPLDTAAMLGEIVGVKQRFPKPAN